jgi:hypothetical protein
LFNTFVRQASPKLPLFRIPYSQKSRTQIKSCCFPKNSLYHHGRLDGVWFSWLAIKSTTAAIAFIIFHRCSLTIQGSSFPSTENNKPNRKIEQLIPKKNLPQKHELAFLSFITMILPFLRKRLKN